MTLTYALELGVATSEDCDREAFGDHRMAAIALADSLYQAAYPCDVCTGWHLGERGPLVRCDWCLTPILWKNGKMEIAPGVYRNNGHKFRTDPETGHHHDRAVCLRLQGLEKPPVTIVGRASPGTCGVCGTWHQRIRTADTGMAYCPPCYGHLGHLKDGPRGGAV